MARIQQSIEINVPVHAAYSKLAQFDEYPRFMQGVEAVRQTDESHLHWSAKMADRNMEWDSEITEQLEDRRIAWRNLSGPQNAGQVELQEMGQDKASVTLTMECDPNQMLGSVDGNAETVMSQRMWEDLARFKKLVESRDTERADWRQSSPEQADAPQVARTTQSNASLSQASDQQDEQGRFGIAEEQNFDEQSDQARRVGQMPQDMPGADPASSMAQAMQPPDAEERRKLGKALDRSLPESDGASTNGTSGNNGS